MNHTWHWYDYITINIYWLGLTTLAQTMAPLVLPLLVQQFVGEAAKGTAYGTLRLWTLMMAVLVQALMGTLSDRNTSRWGRRRPFILIGTIADLLFITAIGFSAGMKGMSGYWFLFAMYLLLIVAANTAQAAEQGLIPDLIPENRRGRFSSVKAILELPLPTMLVAFTVARLISKGDLWGGLLVVVGVLVATMLLTLPTREQPLTEPSPPLDWQPFGRLALMTGVFTAIILGMGEAIKLAGRLAGNLNSTVGLLLVMGGVGLVAMVVAVGMGVWASVRIAAGSASQAHSAFTWWVINRLAYLAGAVNLGSFAVYFLQARLRLTGREAVGKAALLMMVIGVTILLAALPSGWLADRFGCKRLVGVSGIIAALGTLSAILAPNMTVLIGSGCLIGAATGLFYTANWALGTELVPRNEAGRYLGLSNLAGAGAGAVGAYIGGPIADYLTIRLPDQPGMGYLLLFAIYGMLFLFSVVALSQVHEPRKEYIQRRAPGGSGRA